jgi:cell wall-associated NlpC family hydrolase
LFGFNWALRSAGFAKVPTTGKYGAATVAVVKIIQERRHLKRTGEVNAEFRKALQACKIIATTVVVRKPVAKPVPKAPQARTKGEKALAYAKKQLGDRYVYGGAGPNGWDCSGLTMKAWKAAGVTLSHSAGQQYRIGKKISKSNLRIGALSRHQSCGAVCRAMARSSTHHGRVRRCPASR